MHRLHGGELPDPDARVIGICATAVACNAAAESTKAQCENEAVAAGSPFRTDIGTLTMNYVHWYGNERLHSQLGNVTPEEYEQAYYASTTGTPNSANGRR